MLRTIIRNGFLSKKGAFFDKYSFRFLFFSLIFLLFFSMSCPAEKVGILLPLRLIPEKPDLLLLAAVDPADIEKTAEKAVRTGIPVISCDRPVMSRKIPWCVTFDSWQAGELQGEFLADLLDLDHSRDAVYRVEFICGSRASDQESEPDGQGTDSREEGGQICAGALEFLQPYMDEGLLTSLARIRNGCRICRNWSVFFLFRSLRSGTPESLSCRTSFCARTGRLLWIRLTGRGRDIREESRLSLPQWDWMRNLPAP